MPTNIYFAAGTADRSMHVTVKEEPSQVLEAVIAAGGAPFRLTAHADNEIYINVATVAYWQAHGTL